MLEAVNSVLSNASYTRAAAEQQSVVNSYAANPERVQQVSTAAPYISLYIKVDVNFDRAILQVRDIDTGDVVRQIPTETQLEAYRRAQTSNAVRPATLEEEDIVELSAPQAEEPQVADVPDVPVQTQSPAPQAESAPVTTTGPAPTANVSVDTEA